MQFTTPQCKQNVQPLFGAPQPAISNWFFFVVFVLCEHYHQGHSPPGPTAVYLRMHSIILILATTWVSVHWPNSVLTSAEALQKICTWFYKKNYQNDWNWGNNSEYQFEVAMSIKRCKSFISNINCHSDFSKYIKLTSTLTIKWLLM